MENSVVVRDKEDQQELHPREGYNTEDATRAHRSWAHNSKQLIGRVEKENRVSVLCQLGVPPGKDSRMDYGICRGYLRRMVRWIMWWVPQKM